MPQSKMTIGRKFALSGGFAIFMTIALGVASLLGLSGADKSLAAVADDSLAGVSSCSRVESGLLALHGDMWRHIAATDQRDKESQEQQMQQLRERIRTDLVYVQKAIYADGEREINRKIQPLLDRVYKSWDDVLDLSRSGQNAQAYKKYVAEAAPAFEAAKTAVAAETEYNRSSGARNSEEARAESARVRSLIWAVLAVSVSASAGMMFLMIRSVNQALMRAVSEVSGGAEQVASAATQIASASQALAQGSSEQAASLQETSSSSEEINSMAHKNTENTHAATELSGRLQEGFSHAKRSLDDTVGAMHELTNSSEKISKIIKVIDEIAFQTNILALNAAVEAARAGEAGMGFAVVADEVRNLAQRSAQAARDTASLIEDSIARSRDSKAKVDNVAVAIRSIAQDSNRIHVLVDEVNMASQEQSRGIQHVAKAVTQIENVTQRAAASAEESASAATELTAQASTLKDVVKRLSEMVGVQTRRTPSPVLRTENPRAEAPAVVGRLASRKEFPLHANESDS